ncbi:MAG: hypothetical protein ACFFA1_06500 [Promethearchaeota archaeon]
MTRTITLWEHDVFPDQTVKIDLPLTSKVNLEELKSKLGVPEYVDLSYFPMQKAIVTLWACKHAHELHNMYPNVIGKKISKKPVKTLLFGGGAIKMLCPSANIRGSPFNRTMNDVDFLVSRKHHKELKTVLLILDDIAGTRYLHFVTPYEERYNTMRPGRVLIRTFNKFSKDGKPIVGLMDILSDRVEMRHTIDVREDLKISSEECLYSISPHNLLLTKAQFIVDYPKRKNLPKLEKSQQTYRILPYEYFDKDRIIIGMEDKDFLDTAVLLLDHDFGVDMNQINLIKLKSILRDGKLRLTFRLNLQNMLNNLDRLRERGATESQINTIESKIKSIFKEIPEADFNWNKPWWNIDIEVPDTSGGWAGVTTGS